jgi:hypothetical protein
MGPGGHNNGVYLIGALTRYPQDLERQDDGDKRDGKKRDPTDGYPFSQRKQGIRQLGGK